MKEWERQVWELFGGKYLHATQLLHCPSERPSEQGMGWGSLQPTASEELKSTSNHIGFEADPASVDPSDETPAQHNTLIAACGRP